MYIRDDIIGDVTELRLEEELTEGVAVGCCSSARHGQGQLQIFVYLQWMMDLSCPIGWLGGAGVLESLV